MTRPEEHLEERRVNDEKRARITRTERAALRAEDRRFLVKGVAILTFILLLVLAAVLVSTVRSQRDRDRSVRESCHSGNVTRAQIRSLVLDDDTPALVDIEEHTPIIECDLLPQVRRPVSPAIQKQFVVLVAAGASPVIRDGRIAFTP